MQGHLNKPEFFNAMKSVGIPAELDLLSDLFWIFDLNGDEVVDAKEFASISGLFRGFTVEDKVKSSLQLSSFFQAC